ncbi:MAG: circularly permuted type 2 ATP-grasp protein, partial [Bacteroidales bacterium]|nr:circularly permuted type 2 ATP-grasp protein [Bacteroidales bacterium]
MDSLITQRDSVNSWMFRYGVRFGIYKNGEFKEQIFPFDAIARKISGREWQRLERGLVQRVNALNLFLKDIYGNKQIVKDNVVPEDFVYSSSGYLPFCEGIMPSMGIWSHISGIDLVHGKDDEWYILEDNLRIPSGASYPLIAREITRNISPETFENNAVCDNRNYATLLKNMMDYVKKDGINVILTPGRYNSAYFEHSYFAEKTGAVLVTGQDLYVEDEKLYYKTVGGKQRVGA